VIPGPHLPLLLLHFSHCVVDLILSLSLCRRTIVELAARAKVLINCAGPFGITGEIVVNACIESGCHYVDITGEPTFWLNSVSKYDQKARGKG